MVRTAQQDHMGAVGFGSPVIESEWKTWLLKKYFDGAHGNLVAEYGGGGKRILDAGCGSGATAIVLFGDLLRCNHYVGIDSEDITSMAADRFHEHAYPGEFVQMDIEELVDSDQEPFDVILAEGVLHHTNNVEKSIWALSKVLKPGGKLMFYVSTCESPLRKASDALIKKHVGEMTEDDAFAALMPLTKLGQALGKLDQTIVLDEPIDVLGIPAGTHDLQRLFYYHVCKLYHKDAYSLEELNHHNFDWFRQVNCHLHTVSELRRFCINQSLTPFRIVEESSGVTIHAMKD